MHNLRTYGVRHSSNLWQCRLKSPRRICTARNPFSTAGISSLSRMCGKIRSRAFVWMAESTRGDQSKAVRMGELESVGHNSRMRASKCPLLLALILNAAQAKMWAPTLTHQKGSGCRVHEVRRSETQTEISSQRKYPSQSLGTLHQAHSLCLEPR